MHYRCEIVLPADTEDIGAAIAGILEPFNENNDEAHRPFWDFYSIGGRFSGDKAQAALDPDKLQEFYDWLKGEGVTVSGFTCGKQTLKPESQIEKVDAKWNELFPSESGEQVACPIFDHSNDRYNKDTAGTLGGDICRLGDVLGGYTCSRVIFAAPSWEEETERRTGPLEAVFMLCDSFWNGVNHEDSAWGGSINDAREKNSERMKNYKEDYRASHEPTDDWLCVTIDYHS